jgi:hypothetical protein
MPEFNYKFHQEPRPELPLVLPADFEREADRIADLHRRVSARSRWHARNAEARLEGWISPDELFARADEQRDTRPDLYARERAAIAKRLAAVEAEELRMHALGAYFDSGQRKWRLPSGRLVKSAIHESTYDGRRRPSCDPD